MPLPKREKRQTARRRARQPEAAKSALTPEPKLRADQVRAARAEAAAQIERREQRDAAWRQYLVLAEMRRDKAAGALHGKLKIRASRFLGALELEPVALPDEDLGAATLRVLAERGATDDQIADLVVPGAHHDDAARKRAERARRKRLAALEQELVGVDADLAWRAERDFTLGTAKVEARRERIAVAIANMKTKNKPGPRR